MGSLSLFDKNRLFRKPTDRYVRVTSTGIPVLPTATSGTTPVQPTLALSSCKSAKSSSHHDTLVDTCRYCNRDDKLNRLRTDSRWPRALAKGRCHRAPRKRDAHCFACCSGSVAQQFLCCSCWCIDSAAAGAAAAEAAAAGQLLFCNCPA